jgi:3-oxoadipate CoA-transferase, beta subunit
MTAHARLTRHQIAQLLANDLPDGAVVNLGIGMPVLVADHLPTGKEIILHSENGILGMGAVATDDGINLDLIDASRRPITLLSGASISEHTVSFAMIRGGHLDYTVLGAFQVSARGDLANWISDAADAIPAIGGAMDLAVGAKQVLVMMEHLTKDGQSKLVERCSYPLTGARCVNRVYTDLAVIDIKPDGLHLVEIVAEGLSFDELQRLNGVALKYKAAA